VTFSISNKKNDFITFCLLAILSSLILGRFFAEAFLAILIIYFFIKLYSKEIFLKTIFFPEVYYFYFLLFYLIINFFINYYNGDNNFRATFFYFRFFILFLICYLYVDQIILEKVLKYFSFILFFLILDIYFQFFLGFNIIGKPLIENRASSFFGKELIAGSFISKFYLFVLGYILYKFNNIYTFKKLFFFSIVIFLIFISMLFANERSAMFTFLLSLFLFLIFFFRKKIFFLFYIFLVILLIFECYSRLFPLSSRWKNFIVEKYQGKNFVEKNLNNKDDYSFKMLNLFYNTLDNSGHLPLMSTALHMWNDNKVFGTGLKTFREKCNLEKYHSQLEYKYGFCSTHPHNYYIEFLAELGTIGFFVFIFLFLKIILDFIKVSKNKLVKPNSFDGIMLKVFFINFLSFIIVITSGSFFNNWVSFCFWLNVSFFYSIYFRYIFKR